MTLTEKITYLKKISNDRTKGDIFERTTGNILFIGTMDNVADELLDVVEAANMVINHGDDCGDLWIPELREALQKLGGT